jgi:hypothetical protein
MHLFHPPLTRLFRSTLLTALIAVPALGAEPSASQKGVAATPAPAAPPATPASAAPAQEAPAQAAKPEDVATPEAIVAALYDVISGPKGKARDWSRFRSLFAQGARMIPSGKRPDGTGGYRVLSPDEYITHSEKLLMESGFREKEIHRTEERFGPLVHVFSTYEGLREGDAKPFVRGVNSIQLVHDGKRWWVLTVAWTPETPELPLPAKYLKP